MACEISFIPIQSKDYIADIKEVLSIISDSGLVYSVGAMSTLISGEKDKLFELIKTIYNQMEAKIDFTMQLKVSNVCGCENKKE